MAEKRFDVICIGAAIVDLPLRPVTKEVFDHDSYPIDGISMTVGGDAINESTIITRLGHGVSLVSAVGKDVPGAFVMEHCRKNGIDTTWLKEDEALTTSINVGLVTPDGERTFITNRQGSLWKFSAEHLDLSCLSCGRLLSFASFFNNPLLNGQVALEIFKKAKKEGMTICADMVNPRLGETLEDIRDALSMVDYFFPNYSEASRMTGKSDIDEIADVFLSLGVKHVLLKVGSKGALAKSAEERYMLAAYPDSNCIDTTGAGDNFASGFISALLDGKDFRTSVMYANSVASISVEYVGATTGVRNREMAEERFRLYKAAVK